MDGEIWCFWWCFCSHVPFRTRDFVAQISFLSLGAPLRLPRNSDSPKYRTFPEVMNVHIGWSWGSQVFIDAPAATSAPREPGEVHLRRRDILDHCTETDQGPIGMDIWRIVEREWWNLLFRPER